MRPLLLVPGVLVAGLVACSGEPPTLIDQRFAPSCEVVWPAEEGTVLFGESFELAVSISDADTPPEELTVRAVSDLDGIFPGEAHIDDIGATLAVDGSLLQEGYHSLVVTVSDETEVSECETSFFVVANTDPSVNFAEPDDGGVYTSSENIWVEISAFDQETSELSDLRLEWNGIGADQPTSEDRPGSNGTAGWFLPLLPAGNYTIGVRVTDPVGGNRTSSVAFTVIPTDGDGDGWISAGDGGLDCDDGAFAVNPGQIELCNGLDDDCDGQVDEDDAFEAPEWYVDADGDNHGDPATLIVQCTQPSGYIAFGGDCDDADVTVRPGADEVCNGVDDDCNGLVDDAPIDGLTFYADTDGDTFGDPLAPTTACVAGPSVSTDATDCNDADAAANPIANELCGNGQDDDCDGAIDEQCFVDHCGTISQAETWTSDATHRVSCRLVVESTLTILDGTQVEFVGTNSYIEVGRFAPGRLHVLGGARDGVQFTSGTTGGAGGLWFGDLDTGSLLEGFTFAEPDPDRSAIYSQAPYLQASNCLLSDGGHSGIHTDGDSELAVDDCVIERFAGRGIWLEGGRLAQLAHTAVHDVIAPPVELPANEVGSMGPGNDFTGNWFDAVRVSTSSVTVDATWLDHGVPYSLASNLNVGGVSQPTLVLDPGVELRFADGRQIDVGTDAPGRLQVDAASNPVIAEPRDPLPVPGSWDGITFGPYDTGSSIVGLESRYGHWGFRLLGSDVVVVPEIELREVVSAFALQEGLLVESHARASVVDSVFSDGSAVGVRLYGDVSTFSGNAIERNNGLPLVVDERQIHLMDGSNTYVDNTDNRLWISGTLQVDRDRTLQAAPVPWVVGGSIQVHGTPAPTLTLGDGLVAHMRSHAEIEVRTGIIQTEPGPNGVHFTSADPAPSPGAWNSIHLHQDAAVGALGLDGLTIDYAAPLYQDGGLVIDCPDVPVIRDLTVRWAFEDGLYVADDGRVAGIENGHFEGNGLAGIRTRGEARIDAISGSHFQDNRWALRLEEPELIDAVHSDNTFAGNAVQAVSIVPLESVRYISVPTRMRALDVPWLFGSSVGVGGPLHPTLTIEPGATVHMDSDTDFWVGDADLIAVGTAAEPIVFTSAQATPSPGDWRSLHIGDATGGQMSHVIVEYGGIDYLARADGLVRLSQGNPFPFTDVALQHSFGYGLRLTSLVTPWRPDISGITFTGNAVADTNW